MTKWREALTSTGAESQTRVQVQTQAMPNVFNVGIFRKRPIWTQMKLLGLVSAVLAIASPTWLMGQGADQQMLVHPKPDSWPSYHGDYSGRRRSALTQIAPQNVENLALAWAFQTNQSAPIKSSPLLVDGILYFTVPDNIWAVDARSGHQIWHYNQLTDPGRTYRESRRRDIQGLCFLHVSRRSHHFPQPQRRERALEGASCRRDKGILDQHGAASSETDNANIAAFSTSVLGWEEVAVLFSNCSAF